MLARSSSSCRWWRAGIRRSFDNHDGTIKHHRWSTIVRDVVPLRIQLQPKAAGHRVGICATLHPRLTHLLRWVKSLSNVFEFWRDLPPEPREHHCHEMRSSSIGFATVDYLNTIHHRIAETVRLHIWIRHKTILSEMRSLLMPSEIQRLISTQNRITVERCSHFTHIGRDKIERQKDFTDATANTDTNEEVGDRKKFQDRGDGSPPQFSAAWNRGPLSSGKSHSSILRPGSSPWRVLKKVLPKMTKVPSKVPWKMLQMPMEMQSMPWQMSSKMLSSLSKMWRRLPWIWSEGSTIF